MSGESTTLECRQCDTNIAEPEAAKVIVVTETGFGERVIEKRFVGAYVPGDFGLLTITRDGREVARYQPHAWHSVHEDGAAAGDPYYRQGKKLAIALDALRAVAGIGSPDAEEVAAKALDDIMDVDL
jgi:hypothetical protein